VPITERITNARGDWERTATGDDIPKLIGSLKETAEDSYKKAFHENEGNWERISDPSGNPTVVPRDRIDEYRAQGYGRVAVSPSMVMPEVPWEPKRFGPGRHKWKYNRETGEMEAV